MAPEGLQAGDTDARRDAGRERDHRPEGQDRDGKESYQWVIPRIREDTKMRHSIPLVQCQKETERPLEGSQSP